MVSQNTLTKTSRVETIINEKGDTLIQMSLSDAKIILTTILEKEIADSIIKVYESINDSKDKYITLQVNYIKTLQAKSDNQELQIKHLNEILLNKEVELTLSEDIIKNLKKEVRKQKILKIVGFIGSVALPIIVLGVTLGVQ